MTNTFRLDQDSMTRIYERLKDFGEIGVSLFVEDEVIEFTVFNSDRVTYILMEFNLIEPEDTIEFVETTGTIYFYMEK